MDGGGKKGWLGAEGKQYGYVFQVVRVSRWKMKMIWASFVIAFAEFVFMLSPDWCMFHNFHLLG